MGYAEVCVNSPAGRNQSFSYAIPPDLNISVGQAVWVPFGNKILQSIVIELTEKPAVAEVKEIAGVIESRPLLSPEKVALARWLSEYYLSPLFDAISLMLPPGFERRVITFLSRTMKDINVGAPLEVAQGTAESLSPEQVQSSRNHW